MTNAAVTIRESGGCDDPPPKLWVGVGEAEFPSSTLSPWVQTRKGPQEEQEGSVSGPGTAGEQVHMATWASVDLPSHLSCWNRQRPSLGLRFYQPRQRWGNACSSEGGLFRVPISLKLGPSMAETHTDRCWWRSPQVLFFSSGDLALFSSLDPDSLNCQCSLSSILG